MLLEIVPFPKSGNLESDKIRQISQKRTFFVTFLAIPILSFRDFRQDSSALLCGHRRSIIIHQLVRLFTVSSSFPFLAIILVMYAEPGILAGYELAR